METNGIVIICTLLVLTLLYAAMYAIRDVLKDIAKALSIYIEKEAEIIEILLGDEEDGNQAEKEDTNQELRMRDEYQLP
jgi:hypothetical protein